MIFGSGDPASDAVEQTLKDCLYSVDTIFSTLRCNTCDKENKVMAQLALMLLKLSQEPDAKNVAADIRKYILNARK